MKNPVIAYVGWLLLTAALGFYGYGIVKAIIISCSEDPIQKGDFPDFLSTTIGSIQALLLTNLGILLGISVAKPESEIARQLMMQAKLIEIPDPIGLRTKVQLFALIIYILSLIACLVTWIINKFSVEPTAVVSLIPESAKMFVGVVLAYLTAVLGLQRNSPELLNK